MVNKSVHNAVLLLVTLKADPGTKVKDFAKKHGISQNYMENIGHKLVKAKILYSKKGPGGGYVLDPMAMDITLQDLIPLFSSRAEIESDLNLQIENALAKIKVFN